MENLFGEGDGEVVVFFRAYVMRADVLTCLRRDL